jgi:hypothetical protein
VPNLSPSLRYRLRGRLAAPDATRVTPDRSKELRIMWPFS